MNPKLSNANSPFLTLKSFSEQNPDFSIGSLKWLIFNKRDELIEKGVIYYWGRKILIHPAHFFSFILEGGTKEMRYPNR